MTGLCWSYVLPFDNNVLAVVFYQKSGILPKLCYTGFQEEHRNGFSNCRDIILVSVGYKMCSRLLNQRLHVISDNVISNREEYSDVLSMCWLRFLHAW